MEEVVTNEKYAKLLEPLVWIDDYVQVLSMFIEFWIKLNLSKYNLYATKPTYLVLLFSINLQN